MPELTVVYLARLTSDTAPVKTFVESYRRHAAGADHDLLVVHKGARESGDECRRLLQGLACAETEVPDRGFDVGSYIAASRRLETKYVCFLNTFSEILVGGWLGKLLEHAVRPGVGVVGATGSWESFYTTYEKESIPSTKSGPAPYRWARRAWRNRKLQRYMGNYVPAPNPHLRSNAFVIERNRWLSLNAGQLGSKEDLWRFEGGRDSMTRQLLSQGLEALVVGRDGIAYKSDQWPESSTFRSGEQRNLLVADNRTREYEQSNGAQKQRLAQLAWGNHSVGAESTTSNDQ